MDKMDMGGPTGIMREYRDEFLGEIRAALDDVDLTLVNLASEPDSREPLFDLYYRFHTIRGLTHLLQEEMGSRLAQASEGIIEAVRKYQSRFEPATINHLVESAKFLRHISTGGKTAEDSRFSGEVGQHLSTLQQARHDLVMEARQPLERETRIGEILVDAGAMKPSDVEAVLERQKQQPSRMKFGEMALREKQVEAADVIRAIRLQKMRSTLQSEQGVFVPLPQMDDMIRLVDSVRLQAADVHAEALLRFGNKDRFSGDSAELAERLGGFLHVLRTLRMVPLRTTFLRLKRSIGAYLEERRMNVRLSTLGEGVEIDKELSDLLVSPLSETVTMLLDVSTVGDGDRDLGAVEVLAYRESDGVHIDVTGDGMVELKRLHEHSTMPRISQWVEPFGGRVSIDDMMGKGMRARFYLPDREV